MNPFSWIAQKMMRGPSCEEVNNFLAEYVEGVLMEDTRAEFENHMKRCATCGSYLSDYRETIELAKNSHDVKIPDELAEHAIEFMRLQMRDA